MTEKALETKEKISKEFIERYYIFLKDWNTLDTKEFGRKYGCICVSNTPIKDNLKALILFQKNIFNGRFIGAWVKAGYDKQAIWELHREKFLSLYQDNSWEAHQLHQVDFYYISQNTAKQIYKEYKAA